MKVHPEIAAAMQTRRPELVRVLRARLQQEVTPTDVDLLLTAVELLIGEAHETEHRLSECGRILRDQTRSLRGLADASEQLRHVVQRGGSYRNSEEREANYTDP